MIRLGQNRETLVKYYRGLDFMFCSGDISIVYEQGISWLSCSFGLTGI